MSVFKSGAKLSGGIIMAAILGFFLCVSINVICTALFTDYIGYNAYVYTEDSDKAIAEYQYLYTDTDGDGKDNGTDTKKAEYEEQGYTVTTYKVRSTLEGAGKLVFLSITQVLNLVLLIAFASSSVYKQGCKDANLVRTGHLKADSFKGFKIGLIANIMFFVLFAAMVVFTVTTPNFRTVWYAFLNSQFYPIILWISGSADVVSKLSILQIVLLFVLQFIVPVISGIAYILGFKGINFSDKIVYKKGEI